MNILNRTTAGRYEERKQVIYTILRSGKSLEDADAEVEQYMVSRYGMYWRMGMPSSYFDQPQPKRKSFIQRIKDFFGHHE